MKPRNLLKIADPMAAQIRGEVEEALRGEGRGAVDGFKTTRYQGPKRDGLPAQRRRMSRRVR